MIILIFLFLFFILAYSLETFDIPFKSSTWLIEHDKIIRFLVTVGCIKAAIELLLIKFVL